MSPSTGPKHSVTWNHEPGATGAFTPGVQSDAPSLRGSTSHVSPRSRRVSARSSFSSGGPISGPIVVDGSLPCPTRRVRTASASWRWNRDPAAVRVDRIDPTRIASDAAEHFCPACPKAERTRSATARSGSALGVITSAFLPLVSAISRRSGRHDRNSSAVCDAPVSTTWSTAGCVTSRRPASPSSVCTSCRASAGMPPRCRAATPTSAHARTCGAGLITTDAPAASAATQPPSGMAIGKFQGGVTTTTRSGVNGAPSSSSARSA